MVPKQIRAWCRSCSARLEDNHRPGECDIIAGCGPGPFVVTMRDCRPPECRSCGMPLHAAHQLTCREWIHRGIAIVAAEDCDTGPTVPYLDGQKSREVREAKVARLVEQILAARKMLRHNGDTEGCSSCDCARALDAALDDWGKP